MEENYFKYIFEEVSDDVLQVHNFHITNPWYQYLQTSKERVFLEL